MTDHLHGICRDFKEAERERDSDRRSLRRVFPDRKRAENHGVNAGERKAVPDGFITALAAELLFDDDHGGDQREGTEHLLAADAFDFVKRLHADGKHGEADEEGIAVGQVIGEVEAVEGEICPVVRHQRDKESQQTAEADARSQPDPAAGEEDRDEQHGKHRAVDIGQIVAALGGGIAVERAGEHIPEIEIARHGAREFVLRAGGIAQGDCGRDQDPHGKHAPDSGRPDEAEEILDIRRRLFVGRQSGKAGVVLKRAHHVPQHEENADHVADIVIGGDGKSEGDTVEQGTFALHDLFQSVDDKRQQHEAVQPHHVPRIGDEVGVEGVGNRERDGAVVVLFEHAAAEDRKGGAGGGDFQHLDEGDGLGEVVPREEQGDDVVRAAQIIGDQRQEAASHADVVGVGHRAEGKHLLAHEREEGGILVVHVDDHDRFVAEGIDAEGGVADSYPAEGKQRRHPDVIMPDARSASREHGVAYDQGENACGDRGKQAEPRGAFMHRTGHIGD